MNYKTIITSKSASIFDMTTGELYQITSDHEKFSHVSELIRNKRFKTVIKELDMIKQIESATDNQITIKNNKLAILGDTDLPKVIRDHIDKCARNNLPYDAVLNFWKRLQSNVSEFVRKQLFGFMENVGISLTEDGCFIAYKKVDDNFKDCRTHSFDNSPGKIVKMDRKLVDPDPDQTCSNGLHVASFHYMKEYSGAKIVEVKVDPADVVAVPNDYHNSKMRVCRYKVIKEFKHGMGQHANINDIAVDPIYMDDQISKPKQGIRKVQKAATKTTKTKPFVDAEEYKVKRMSKDRVLIPKMLIDKLKCEAGDMVAIDINEKEIIVTKAKKNTCCDFNYKVDSYGAIRLSKSILDKVSKKKNWIVVVQKGKLVVK